MSYDENGRLTGQSQELAGHTEQLVRNTYDNLGQLIQKNVGNSPGAPLQTVDYRYNIRGWLQGINDINKLGSDLFGFSLHYNNPELPGVALFNGNISETNWKFGGKEYDQSFNIDTYDFGARHYNPWAVRWGSIDVMASKYNEYSPYIYAVNNPVLFIDPDGEDPINPQTGKPYKISLYRHAPIFGTVKPGNNPDNKLLGRINNWQRKLNLRGRGGDTGVWEGHSDIRHDLTSRLFSTGANTALRGLLGLENRASEFVSASEAPIDAFWEKAAESGSYSFLAPTFAESEVFFIDEQSAEAVTVEDNYIKQIVGLERNDDGEFDVSKVTSFETKKGEIKTREKKSFFGLITKIEKYRELTVTETVQNYSNNKPSGKSTTRTYTREEIIDH